MDLLTADKGVCKDVTMCRYDQKMPNTYYTLANLAPLLLFGVHCVNPAASNQNSQSYLLSVDIVDLILPS